MSKNNLKNSFNYKVCILAAGAGKRMLDLSKNFNKALLPINYKASISHIIEKFPKEIEIIVAVGHEKEKVSQYLTCAHQDRKIKIVEIDKISGKGSGPGYSLLACKNFLKCPFIFFSVDTIVMETIPLPEKNWMGVAPIKNPSNYCSVSIRDNLIDKLHDKIKSNDKNAFIGLAGIKDYEIFFKALEKNDTLVQNEKQVSNGFEALINQKLYSIFFTWHDIGNIEGYKKTKEKFSNIKEEFNFEKKNEYLYFVEDKVIKYFSDKDIIKKRFLRAKSLTGLCPVINLKTDFFYSYEKVNGNILYDQKNPTIVSKLLSWLDKNLWIKKTLEKSKNDDFKIECKKFYFDKTKNRLNTYYEKYSLKDVSQKINGKKIDTTSNLMSKIDWEWMSDGIPSQFHGDLQFENILISKNDNFTLIDWRQDFSGNLDHGDMYYDLAKLNGGINVSYKNIKQNLFSYKKVNNDITISSVSDPFLEESKKIFDEYLNQKKLDIKKIEILTGLIFLNMAAMHHEPFDHFIYNLGRVKINKWINSRE